MNKNNVNLTIAGEEVMISGRKAKRAHGINREVRKMNEIAGERRKALRESVPSRKQYLRDEGILHTTPDILSALVEAPGLGNKTKNFARVIGAMLKGNDLLHILNNAGAFLPANQVHYAEAFVQENKLSDRLYAKTRYSVLQPVASLHEMEERDGKQFSKIDYSNPHTYNVNSENYISELFASDLTDVMYPSIDGEDSFSRRMLTLYDFVSVDLYQEIPEDEDDIDEETRELIELSHKMMRDGFYFIDKDNVEQKALFLMQSPSQARTMQGFFVVESFMKPEEVLVLTGNDPLAYAKWNEKDQNWNLDVSRMLKRPGLSLTNTIKSDVIQIGNEVITHEDDQSGFQYQLKEDEYRIVGGTHDMLVAEDRFAEIKEGEYRIFDETSSQFVTKDASVEPLIVPAADGALFYDDELYHVMGMEFGREMDACQVRITPFGKGLAIFIPGLKKMYGASIVALQSAIKGDFRTLLKHNPDYKIQFRVAIFAKGLHEVRRFSGLPYQFTHATSLNFNHLWSIVEPHLNEVKEALHNPEVIQRYLGLGSLINLEDMADEEQQHAIDTSLVSTLTTFLHHAPESYEDAYMKRLAMRHLQDKIKDWKHGSIPVEGHYRWMIQDPLAVLDAGIAYEVRDEKGRLLMIEDASSIPADASFMLSVDGDREDLFGTDVAVGRNPMVTKGQMRVLRVTRLQKYMEGVRKGAFRNLCIMSCFDLNTVGMGGADNDGDTCLTTTNEIVIESLLKRNSTPILDMTQQKDGFVISGCPYAMNLAGVYSIEEGLVHSQDDYKISFTDDQLTGELRAQIHQLSIDYVIRTLKPNKIGLATNIATILADAVRGLAYQIAEGKETLSAYETSLMKSKIDNYEYWIDLMYLVQSWEIDAAKHGGQYQEELKDLLFFMDNPPAELSRYVKSLGKRVWEKPDWLAAIQDKEGKYRGSVLSRLYHSVTAWEKKNLSGVVEEMLESVKDYSLLGELTSAISMPVDYFMNLSRLVEDIKSQYGGGVRSLHKGAEEQKEMLLAQSMAPNQLEHACLLIDREANNMIEQVATEARAQMQELALHFPAKDIGFVAYYITYADQHGRQSLSFPWTVGREQFIQTLLYVQNKEAQDQVSVNEIVDTNVSFSMCIPSEIQEVYSREEVVQSLISEGAYILVADNKYRIFIADKTPVEVGFLFSSKGNIMPLLGHDKFKMLVSTADLGNGKHTVHLIADKLVKA